MSKDVGNMENGRNLRMCGRFMCGIKINEFNGYFHYSEWKISWATNIIPFSKCRKMHNIPLIIYLVLKLIKEFLKSHERWLIFISIAQENQVLRNVINILYIDNIFARVLWAIILRILTSLPSIYHNNFRITPILPSKNEDVF